MPSIFWQLTRGTHSHSPNKWPSPKLPWNTNVPQHNGWKSLLYNECNGTLTSISTVKKSQTTISDSNSIALTYVCSWLHGATLLLSKSLTSVKFPYVLIQVCHYYQQVWNLWILLTKGSKPQWRRTASLDLPDTTGNIWSRLGGFLKPGEAAELPCNYNHANLSFADYIGIGIACSIKFFIINGECSIGDKIKKPCT